MIQLILILHAIIAPKVFNIILFLEIIILVLTCLVRISVSVSFGIKHLYTNEIYPTAIRSIGSGFVYSFVYYYSISIGFNRLIYNSIHFLFGTNIDN